MIQRNITSEVLAALGDTPVVLINGARQTGKSTLAKQITEGKHPARYLPSMMRPSLLPPRPTRTASSAR
jgi:hypothetical protein